MRTALSNGLITIRRYDTVDVPSLCEAARESSPEVSVWLPWCHSHYSMEESLEWILRSGKRWDEKREFHFGIFDSQSGAFVGGVGLNELKPEHRLANLGIGCGRRGRVVALQLLPPAWQPSLDSKSSCSIVLKFSRRSATNLANR
jgi:RimJ/RimL family protein N-acetyltransferase